MLRKLTGGFLLLAVLLLVTLVASAPRELANGAVMPEIGSNPEEWLAQNEQQVHRASPIIPNTEKRISWHDGLKGSKTPYALVYLHGFSATRQEIAPVGEMIASELGANVFETRLAGHGLEQQPLAGVRAEDWLADAAEALAVGAAIGERVIVMGTSTGATLALAMASHPAFQPVDSIILLSPNFALRDSNTEFLTWPGGPQLAQIVVGENHSWEARNELQARYWATSYPMDAVVEMMRLVQYVRAMLPMQIEQSVLTFYSPLDSVVDVEQIRSALKQIDSPRKKLVEIPASDDPGNHVLAGDIMSPANNEMVSGQVVRFIRSDNNAH